jgi:hypothetical protein
VLLRDGSSTDSDDFGDLRIEESLPQDALPNHTCGSSEDDAHEVILPNTI